MKKGYLYLQEVHLDMPVIFTLIKTHFTYPIKSVIRLLKYRYAKNKFFGLSSNIYNIKGTYYKCNVGALKKHRLKKCVTLEQLYIKLSKGVQND